MHPTSYAKALFCDESGMHGDARYLYIGALRCSFRRAEILHEQLLQVRQEHSLIAEMKWGKVSPAYLLAYQAWVKVFVDDPYCRFWAMRTPKSEFARKKEERYIGAYQTFLFNAVPWAHGCRVVVDGSDLRRRSHWDRVCFIVNRARGGRCIRTIRAVDSHSHNLIQLTDVLLGALAARDMNTTQEFSAKRQLIETIEPAFEEGRIRLWDNDWTTSS
ncbi:MAG: DUF3800 domain-containing protein [Thermomicrobiales bacterium]